MWNGFSGHREAASLPFVKTEIDSATSAMFARNPWNMAFGSRIAFIDLRGVQTDWTGDRREFIGRNGTLANPAAFADAAPLSNTVGAGLDPCGAMRTKIELPPDGVIEIVLLPRTSRETPTRPQGDRSVPRRRS